MQALYVNFQPR